MKNLFVPYELAVKLKEKGFDEPCFAIYNNLSNGRIDLLQKIRFGKNTMKTLVAAPLYQQVQDWLREKHNLHIYIDTTPAFDKIQGSKYKTAIKVPFRPFKWTTGHYYLSNTYYEALNKAIEEALKII